MDIISKEDYSVIFDKYRDSLEGLRLKVVETLEDTYFYDRSSNLLSTLVNKQRNLITLARKSQTAIVIGVDCGFLVLLMLMGNPRMEVTCFDTCEEPYTRVCFEYLQSLFPQIRLIEGDSKATLPQYTQESAQSVDLIHVRGSQNYLQSNLDFFNAKGIARHGTYLVWDDMWYESQRKLWSGYKDHCEIRELGMLETKVCPHAIGTYFKPRIGVCTLALGDEYKEIVKYGQRTKVSYAQKHSYALHQDEDIYDPSRPYAWSKIKLIQRYLSSYDYLVWIDADTFIMNDNHKLEHIIHNYMGDFDITISRDWVNPSTGVMFIRNSQWSHKFFEVLYEQTDFIDHSNWEQGAFIHMFNHNMLEAQEHILILPLKLQYLFNCYWFNYNPGYFLLHFPGCYRDSTNRGLTLVMSQFCPIKMDEETEEAFAHRREFLKAEVVNFIEQKRLAETSY